MSKVFPPVFVALILALPLTALATRSAEAFPRIELTNGTSIEGATNPRHLDQHLLFTVDRRQQSIPLKRVERVFDASGALVYERAEKRVREKAGAHGSREFLFFVNDRHVATGRWEQGRFELETLTYVPDGLYQLFHDNGKVGREWTITDGELSGVARLYYRSGILEREGEFVNGRETGVSRLYFPTGALKGKSTFAEGRKHGKTEIFYESGALRTEMHFERGVASGVQKMYAEDGSLLAELTFREGVKHGPVRQFYRSGQVKMEGSYVEDRLDGIVVNFWPSGRVKHRRQFVDGRILRTEDNELNPIESAAIPEKNSKTYR